MEKKKLLDEHLLREIAVIQGPYQKFEYKAETSSTNEDLKKAILSDLIPIPDWTVVIADYQTTGRGRHGRKWSAPVGTQAIMSVLLSPPDIHLSQSVGLLPLSAGLAVIDTLKALYPSIPVELKWPNDVMVNGKKLCGILGERVENKGKTHFIVGLGVNSTMMEEELPVPTATSLALEGVENVDMVELYGALMMSLFRRFTQWRGNASEREALRREYISECSTIGKDVRIILPNENIIEGRCTGISNDGSVEIEHKTSSGLKFDSFSAGDITHLRLND